MKIRPDQIEGIQSEKQHRKDKTAETGQAFGDVLNQEVARGDQPAATQGVVPPPIVNPLIAASTVQSVQAVDNEAASVVGQVETILDKWDSYAATLDSDEGLKSAYGTLDEIADEVAALKEEQPDLAVSNPGLQAIVDELETMTATEQFKFNRGDYV